MLAKKKSCEGSCFYLHRINGNCKKFAAKGGMSGFPKRVATARGADIMVPYRGEISEERHGSLNPTDLVGNERASSRIIWANLHRKVSRVPGGEIDVELQRQTPRRTTASPLHPPKTERCGSTTSSASPRRNRQRATIPRRRAGCMFPSPTRPQNQTPDKRKGNRFLTNPHRIRAI